MTTDALVALIDRIGQPVILLLHSGVATSGWELADARPKLVKGIVAAEAIAPPIENAERGSSGPGRLWGLTDLPVHYDPAIQDPSELHPVREEKADGPGLIPCWVQKEPAHKLVNLESIPVLEVSGEASYHRPYSHCDAKWLNQAGVKTTFVRLEDVGLRDNGPHDDVGEEQRPDRGVPRELDREERALNGSAEASGRAVSPLSPDLCLVGTASALRSQAWARTLPPPSFWVVPAGAVLLLPLRMVRWSE